ncbi:hypothetical protein TPCV302_10470 [Cutibacterium avidum]|nr:hypothetical protein TPCV14_04440 [Cutibacterium avidum]BDY01655.1 hypothetical protein TPCV302_10470 [Cutibacterium avidum]
MNPGRSRHCDAIEAKSDQNRAHLPRPGWDYIATHVRGVRDCEDTGPGDAAASPTMEHDGPTV